MLSNEQFEKIERDIKRAMEDYSIKVKILNDLDGIDENCQFTNCRLQMFMSNVLADGLLEYAKSNFNDIQTVMSRTIEPNDLDRHFSDEQGFVDEFGCINFYDGIFHYEFKNNRLENVYLKFMSVGIGKYYSRYFRLTTFSDEEFMWFIEISQRSEHISYILDTEKKDGNIEKGRRKRGGRKGW